MFKAQLKKFTVCGDREVGSEQKKKNEGGWEASYYNNIMHNVIVLISLPL